MHRMMEGAGPAQMMLGGPMKQGQAQTLTFGKTGIYRFMTKVSPTSGMPHVATVGPDNTLRLTAKVVYPEGQSPRSRRLPSAWVLSPARPSV